MKVAGIRMTDPWASRVLRDQMIESEQLSGLPVETVVQMDRVAFEHHGRERNYRPLLHLAGELRAIVTNGQLPHGIEEVTFREGTGPIVDAFYEFDDAQLAELVSKGYFTEGFEPPTEMAGIPWWLPTTIDALVLPPEDEGDTPVVFVTVNGQSELALDAENSGYNLAEYFESHVQPGHAPDRATEIIRDGSAPTRSGEINDLFAGEEFIAPDLAHLSESARTARPVAGTDYPVVRTGIFDGLMAEFQNRLPSEDPEPVEDEEETPEVDELAEVAAAIYRDRIEPGVAQALSLPAEGPNTAAEDLLEQAAATVVEGAGAVAEDAGTGLLDLYAKEDDLDVVPLATAPAAEDVWDARLVGEPLESVEDEDAAVTARTRRRVQLAAAHEQALAAARDDADEPQLA